MFENEVDPSGTGSYCDWDLGFRYTDEARGHMQGLMPTQQLRIGPGALRVFFFFFFFLSLSPHPPFLFFSKALPFFLLRSLLMSHLVF